MSFLVYKLTGQKGLHVHWNKVEYGSKSDTIYAHLSTSILF